MRPRTLVFYISGHGFGHASRDVEIIRALVATSPDLRIIIRSAVNPGLLTRTLTTPFELRPGPCDTGIIQRSSIEQDDAATVREAIAFYERYQDRIDAEVETLANDKVSLVVSDIAPLGFEVASRLNVPSIAVANFTWDWIYAAHPGMREAAPWLVPTIRASYVQATQALELPFAGGFDVFPRVSRLPLVARHATRTRRETRAHFELPAEGRIGLLSFGGYGLPALNLSTIDCLAQWTFVTTDRLSAAAIPAQVQTIPEQAFMSSGFRYEDLVAAADVVITKPGYGIIAECVSTGTAMLYTSRGEFREYDLLTREMPRFIRSRFISNDALLAGRWGAALDALLDQPPARERLPTDGDVVAARVIRDALDAAR